MKRIAVFTGGRSDISHLWWVIDGIHKSKKLELMIFAPQNHPNIEDLRKNNNFFDIFSIWDLRDYGVTFNYLHVMLKFEKPDIFLCLGDRWETHAAATAALLSGTKICHIHGGETTEGCFDDELRNSITMMSQIHFVSHIEYGEKILQMTNKLDNIHIVGSPGLDWLTKAKLYTKAELKDKVSINLEEPYILACFNPVTHELSNTEIQIGNFMYALGAINEQVLLIRPNMDPKNEAINDMINKHLVFSNYSHVKAVDNINHLTYLSLMKYALMMVGNSSSGVIEAASLNLPVVDIGNRQKGRIMPDNVIHCGYETEDILEAIKKATYLYSKLHSVHRDYDWEPEIVNPYGDGNSAEKIVKVLEEI